MQTQGRGLLYGARVWFGSTLRLRRACCQFDGGRLAGLYALTPGRWVEEQASGRVQAALWPRQFDRGAIIFVGET